jgi:NaMN:DMB phosphoribosyltransferase
MDPSVKRCLFLSHRSAEKGAQVVLSVLSAPGPVTPLPPAGAAVQSSPAAPAHAGPFVDLAPGTGAASAAAGAGACAAALGMGMRLGEGTGAVMCLPLLRSAAAIMCTMGSLGEVMELGSGEAV